MIRDSNSSATPARQSGPRNRRSRIVATGGAIALLVIGLGAELNQWLLFQKGVYVLGFLKQYAIAARQYESESGVLPPIDEWRIVARSSPDDPIPASLFDVRVAPVRSRFWGGRLLAPSAPLVAFSPDGPFPEGTRFVDVDGVQVIAVDANGMEHPFATKGIYVLMSNSNVQRLDDIPPSSDRE